MRRRNVFAKYEAFLLNTERFLSIEGDIDNLKLDDPKNDEPSRLRKDLDKVKGDAESLDEVDNDNDDDRDDKDDEYDKGGDDDDINANNDKVNNPREIRPTYYSTTDSCNICNNYFINTTTEILNEVHDIEVIDLGAIYFEECRHIIHTKCITRCCGGLESITYPCCGSVGLFLDRQSSN